MRFLMLSTVTRQQMAMPMHTTPWVELVSGNTDMLLLCEGIVQSDSHTAESSCKICIMFSKSFNVALHLVILETYPIFETKWCLYFGNKPRRVCL
ncbi:hypothetical protein J4Q44_G00125320 [Coregonus suidteri]|uniref:Uncharacterized protein n=1 Tax=Coregonus suidteri TaxID=861788 RepID=A0AAN8LXF0_9TELE